MTRVKALFLAILFIGIGATVASAGSNSITKIDFQTALSYLAQDDARLCRNGAYVLGEIGDKRAVGPLTSKLKSDDSHLRRIAATALGKIRDKDAVMPLIEVLCNPDEQVEVQTAAVKALGKLEDERAVRILGHLAGNENSRLQAEAYFALKRLSPVLTKIDFQTAMVYLDQDDMRLCRNAAYALGEVGDKHAVGPLVSKLKSDDRHLRRIAATALGKIGDKEAVMPLVEVLSHPTEHFEVQMATVKALGRIGDTRAVFILAQLASGEKSRLQSEAGYALEKLSPMLYAAYEAQ